MTKKRNLRLATPGEVRTPDSYKLVADAATRRNDLLQRQAAILTAMMDEALSALRRVAEGDFNHPEHAKNIAHRALEDIRQMAEHL